MTKDEIKKGLKQCALIEPGPCTPCPYYHLKDCDDTLKRQALNLITEQEKEIEFQVKDRARLQQEIGELEQAHEQRVEEIDTLKAKNKVLGDGVGKAFTNGFTDGRKEVEKDIRRAQINILCELKKCIETAIDTYWNSNGGGYYLAEDAIEDIDELIKEVENDRSNQTR